MLLIITKLPSNCPVLLSLGNDIIHSVLAIINDSFQSKHKRGANFVCYCHMLQYLAVLSINGGPDGVIISQIPL